MTTPSFGPAFTFTSELFLPYAPSEDLRIEVRPLHPVWMKERLYPNEEAPYNWQIRTPFGSREWFVLSRKGIAAAARHAVALAPHYEVYCGVLPRSGRTGKQSDVTQSAWLWCDVDGGTDGVEGAIQLVKASGLPWPHMVVVSGGGLHSYWKLAEPVSLLDEVARKRFKDVLKRLCLRIGGTSPGAHADSSRADSASILRVPGTFNHKHETEPRAVRLLHEDCKEEGLPLTWWRACLPALPAPPPPRPPVARSSPIAQGEGLLRWAQTPYAEGKRHKELVSAAAWLIRELGLTKELAYELLCLKAQASAGTRHIPEDEIRSMVQWA